MKSDGKIIKEVAPGTYVWMVKAKHALWVHPDNVKGREKIGYKKSEKVAKK